MPAYITGLGVCLPNDAVDNEHIEDVLGMIHGEPARSKEMILESNGIKTRHYAIDPRTGEQTHTNAELTAAAIRALSDSSGLRLDQIDLLACGSSCPDQLIPNHAAMVQGLLRCGRCEIVSTAGACCSSMAALKYATMSVSSGLTANAVVTGSELVSAALCASHFESQMADGSEPRYLTFDEEFLRWMLSDGAAAVLVESEPGRGHIALRIDWLDIISLANELETCMYMGGLKTPDGSLRGWLRTGLHAGDPWTQGYFNLAQDVRILKKQIVPVAMKESFTTVRDKRNLTADTIDWLLPHLSSEFFREPVCGILQSIGFVVPREKWFTNLTRKGNTGSASIFIMLEELFSSGRLEKGDRILCVVPESARFTFGYMHLTVV